MMLFAISYMAFRLIGHPSEEIEVYHGAAIMVCDTAEEAHGHYMDVALKRWPQGEGWRGHSVVMGEFDTKWTVGVGGLQVTHELKGKAVIGLQEIDEIEESQFSM
jgi:hypothetical protein